jgi:hypothetical protein
MVQAYIGWLHGQWAPFVAQAEFYLGDRLIAWVYVVFGAVILSLLAYHYATEVYKDVKTLGQLILVALGQAAAWIFMAYYLLGYWPLLVLVFALVDLGGTVIRSLLEKRRCSPCC